MIIFFFILLALIRLGIIQKKIFLEEKWTGILWLIYTVLVCLFLSALLLAEKNIYFRGYRSTSFIFIAMSVSGFIFSLNHQRDSKRSIANITLYVASVVCFILAAIFSFIISSEYHNNLYYNDTRYRLENETPIFGPCTLPKLYIKNGLFEKKYNLNGLESGYGCITKEDIVSLSVEEKPGNIVSVTIHHKSDTARGIPNPLIRNVSLTAKGR